MTAEQALLAAIEAEDAAVYAYGVIGAHLDGPAERRARRALHAHRSLRTQWQSQATAQVATPAAYDLPFTIEDATSAKELAVLVERRVSAISADLAAVSTGPVREQAVTAAMEAATRSVVWGGEPQSFPHG